MIYKNWKAICKEPNYLLRLLVALTTDAKLLRSLVKGFPRLFTAKKPTRIGPIPASALREASEKVSRDFSPEDYEPWTRELSWNLVADAFGLVNIYVAEPNLLQDFRKQLVGQPFNSGIRVMYRGMEHFVIGLGVGGFVLGTVYRNLDQMLDIQWVVLSPCALIDMNA